MGSLISYQAQESTQVPSFDYFPCIHSFFLLQHLILVLDMGKKILNTIISLNDAKNFDKERAKSKTSQFGQLKE